jgi:hypothetical protein
MRAKLNFAVAFLEHEVAAGAVLAAARRGTADQQLAACIAL